MDKIPVSLIVDDPAPRVHVYWSHSPGGKTPAGVALRPDVPNSFLDEFCDLVEKEGMKGKFSIVPMAGCQGDILNGFSGYPDSEIREWIETVNTRLKDRFSFCPEMLTHHKAYDMEKNSFYDCNEMEWASTQTRATLRPYIAKALGMLKQAGIRAVGVTSPWAFGIEVEEEYAAAISDAVWDTWQTPLSWYFLRSKTKERNAKPWVPFRNKERRTVAIPATTGDMMWSTIDVPSSEVNADFLSAVADKVLTEDGKSGCFVDALERDSDIILINHWQSLFSNGSKAGLHSLAIAVSRINRLYGDRIEWKSFEELAEITE